MPPTRPLAAILAVLLVTAGATTAPTTAPALDPQVSRWFDQLADADPAVRDAAAQALMGLPADGLPKLLAVVRAARPVRPAQAAALHEVVCQIYLAAEPYVGVGSRQDPLARPPHYMMGIHWTDPPQVPLTPRLGVPVGERWPGFPARRMLREGDMILGVYIDRDGPLERPPNAPTPTRDVITNAIAAAPPGVRDVDLSVLRDGREIRVPIHMVLQPVDVADAEAMAGDAFIEARQQRAEAYWQQSFAPLLTPAGPVVSLDD